MNKTVDFQDLGIVPYQQAWDYQEALFKKTIATKIENRDLPEAQQNPTPNYLLFCEHPHVYTLGKSGSLANLLLTPTELTEKKIEFFPINRGGDITYHGPGQIVGYPILDLDNFFTDIHKYLRFLEEAIIRTLASFGLDTGRVEGLTGVWVDYQDPTKARKICAMGIKTSRWVTMHGFALNVNVDLDYFSYIVPCGITDKAVTSLAKELGKPQDIYQVTQKLLSYLEEVFEMKIEKSI